MIRTRPVGLWDAAPLALCAIIACAPDLTTKASDVVAPRVIGVRADPAEARPGQTVKWTAIVVSPQGFVEEADVRWGMCLAPRGPTDSITVAATCLGRGPKTDADGNPLFVKLENTGVNLSGTVPSDVCKKLGPQLPPVNKDGEPQRAPDPDITGGYQMPLRLVLDYGSDVPDVTFYRQRIKCDLANAPAQVARDYAAKYVLNKHPSIETLQIDGTDLPADGAEADVPAGKTYTLKVRWPTDSREEYVRVNPETRSLETRTESIDVTWFTDGGSFAHDRTTPASAKGRSATNALTLEASRKDPVHVWILVHDERGGLAVSTLTLNPT
jgi:hypothetical protein